MKQLIICTLLLCACHSQTLYSQSPQTGTLEIRFTNIRSEKGSMAIGINTSEKGWPRKAEIELNWKKENLKDGVFVVQARDLPFGTMAISVLDDESGNLDMDMTLGIPREGFGFSNDAPIRGLSSPKFDACSFQFARSGQQISIELRYMGKGK
jgi:uncharacterized protein (DUF2141 family)